MVVMRFLVIGALAFLVGHGEAAACTRPDNAATLSVGMIEWINAQRQAKGLGRLQPSEALEAAAQGHACDMADRGYFEHQRPGGGPNLAARVRAQGYRYGRVAENIAMTGAADVATTAKLWRDSPGHWANILMPDVAQIGMGLAVAKGRTYWVMNVGRRR